MKTDRKKLMLRLLLHSGILIVLYFWVAEKLQFPYIMFIYLAVGAVLGIYYLIYNRGFVGRNTTPDMLPDTMTMEEKELVIRETVETAAGRVPVICGTGSNNTMAVIEAEKRFRSLGCAAQLVVTPYYNKTTQEGLYRHFMTIAENTELPIILYNVPSRTNVDISADTLRRLAACDRFIALKESSAQINAVMAKVEAMDGKLALYSGSDDMVYPFLSILSNSSL